MIETILQHLVPLQVVVPLIAAPVCAMLPCGRVAWGFMTAVSWVVLAIAIALIFQVLEQGTLTYAMGNWVPPIGIGYRVDLLSAFVLVLVSGIGAVCSIFALRSVEEEIYKMRHSNFYAVYLLCLTGLLGITITNDAFNLYVFLEISSLATYTLIAMGYTRKSLTAGFQYLVLGTIGATFILIGIGLLYMMTGTLNITDLSMRILEIDNDIPIKAAFAFMTMGLAMKIALFPLHIWLTNAYAYSPSFVAAFLSATATKVSIYVLIRFIYSLFGFEFSFEAMPLAIILLLLSVAAILIGSFSAVFQRNVRRLLAFSSIAQIGYIMLGVSLAKASGMVAAVLHLVNHGMAKGALFLAIGCISYSTGGRVWIENFGGIGKRIPFTMAAFVISGLSLIGIPFTAGFISKWYLVIALIEQQSWLLLLTIIVSTLLAVIYIWRVVEIAYFRKSVIKINAKIPLSMQFALWIMVALNLIFGVFTDPTVGIAKKIAEILV